MIEMIHGCNVCRGRFSDEEMLRTHICPMAQEGTIELNMAEATIETNIGNPYGGGDAATAIGEDAFRAGYKAGEANGRLIGQGKRPWTSDDENKAWSAYDPPEDIKALA